jgi:hypothetical protein
MSAFLRALPRQALSCSTRQAAAFTFSLDVNSLVTSVNASNPDLTAIEALTGTGVIARTGNGTAAVRTITGTANQIAVTNGDGVSGNPTLSIPAGHFANPSASIGLTANNGSASTAMRSDGTPALSQSIAPTWSGQHAWSGGGIFLGSSGSPPFSVGTGTNPYFGSASNSWQLINTLAGSATVPETGFQSIVNSSTGSANAGTAFKIAMFASGTFASGSANGYGANVVAASTTGFNKLLTGLEVDLNQGSGLTQGTPGAANASYNVVLSGNPSASFPATAALWITGNSVWTNGIYVSNGVIGNTITDISSSSISYVIGGSHSYAIDTTQGTFSGPVFHLGNNQAIAWRNAANSADISGIKISASDQLLVPLRSYLTGLTLSTAGSSATFGIAAGVATDSTNVSMLGLASAYTKTTSAWALGTAAGSLDTGAIANSTWYHVYLIQRPDTGVVDVLTSLSASAPTMPTNYTLKRRIGSMKTNGSAQWTKFIQNGDSFTWDVPTADVNGAGNPGTAAVLRTMSTPLGVIVEAKLFAVASASSGPTDSPSAVYISDPAVTDTAASTSAGSIYLYQGAAAAVGQGGAQVRVFTDTSSQVRTRLNTSAAGTSLYMSTIGWNDRRGKDT